MILCVSNTGPYKHLDFVLKLLIYQFTFNVVITLDEENAFDNCVTNISSIIL